MSVNAKSVEVVHRWLSVRKRDADFNADRGCGRSDQGRFAVADGVSQTHLPDLWADILTDYACNGPDLEDDVALADWLVLPRRQWRTESSDNAEPEDWWVQYDPRGACTLLLVDLCIRDELPVWRVRYRGDTCFFLIREGRVEARFPKLRTEDYSSVVEGILSEPIANGDVLQQAPEIPICPGDIVVLATDELAKWLTGLIDTDHERSSVERLLSLSDHGFDEFVLDLRSRGEVGDDDMSMLIVGAMPLPEWLANLQLNWGLESAGSARLWPSELTGRADDEGELPIVASGATAEPAVSDRLGERHEGAPGLPVSTIAREFQIGLPGHFSDTYYDDAHLESERSPLLRATEGPQGPELPPIAPSPPIESRMAGVPVASAQQRSRLFRDPRNAKTPARAPAAGTARLGSVSLRKPVQPRVATALGFVFGTLASVFPAGIIAKYYGRSEEKPGNSDAVPRALTSTGDPAACEREHEALGVAREVFEREREVFEREREVFVQERETFDQERAALQLEIKQLRESLDLISKKHARRTCPQCESSGVVPDADPSNDFSSVIPVDADPSNDFGSVIPVNVEGRVDSGNGSK
jgi:hypothetical protein